MAKQKVRTIGEKVSKLKGTIILTDMAFNLGHLAQNGTGNRGIDRIANLQSFKRNIGPEIKKLLKQNESPESIKAALIGAIEGMNIPVRFAEQAIDEKLDKLVA